MNFGKEIAHLGIKKCITAKETAVGESEQKYSILCLATRLPSTHAYYVKFIEVDLKASYSDFLLYD